MTGSGRSAGSPFRFFFPFPCFPPTGSFIGARSAILIFLLNVFILIFLFSFVCFSQIHVWFTHSSFIYSGLLLPLSVPLSWKPVFGPIVYLLLADFQALVKEAGTLNQKVFRLEWSTFESTSAYFWTRVAASIATLPPVVLSHPRHRC